MGFRIKLKKIGIVDRQSLTKRQIKLLQEVLEECQLAGIAHNQKYP